MRRMLLIEKEKSSFL